MRPAPTYQRPRRRVPPPVRQPMPIMPTGPLGMERFWLAHSGEYDPSAVLDMARIPLTSIPQAYNQPGETLPAGYYQRNTETPHIYINRDALPSFTDRLNVLRHEYAHYYDDRYDIGPYVNPDGWTTGYPTQSEIRGVATEQRPGAFTAPPPAQEWPVEMQGEMYASHAMRPRYIPRSAARYYPYLNPDVMATPLEEGGYSADEGISVHARQEPLDALYMLLAQDNDTGITNGLLDTLRRMGALGAEHGTGRFPGR
jgi:hypothetical protein